LVNLLDNAIKYTPSGSPITIVASSTNDNNDNSVAIEISDHGPGIPPGEEEKIFDKFYRSNPNDSSGVGLGLAISRGIIEAHGGHIVAKNRPEGGATFRITLPLEGKQPIVSED
jgi:two-component system sensor histidine kinase KdpD